jgi:phosphoribosylamine--glycine ligase
MKILVVGNGGREHVLVYKLAQSPTVTRIYCAPGNAGTADEPNTENLDIRATDTARLLKFCKAEQIDLAVIGPEAPLVQGMVDAFQVANVPVFGPTKAASVLEASKSHAKEIMRLANVPTADYAVFDDPVAAAAHVDERSERPLVVKADGLAAGKGVIVCPNRQDALAAIRHAMVDLAFGDAGKRIVIEEALVGEEASILAIVDGNTILPLEPAQDHKAAYDDDQGPNTGGMGAYSPTPLVTPTLLDDVIEKVLVPIVHTMRREDEPFQGILYAGRRGTAQKAAAARVGPAPRGLRGDGVERLSRRVQKGVPDPRAGGSRSRARRQGLPRGHDAPGRPGRHRRRPGAGSDGGRRHDCRRQAPRLPGGEVHPLGGRLVSQRHFR